MELIEGVVMRDGTAGVRAGGEVLRLTESGADIEAARAAVRASVMAAVSTRGEVCRVEITDDGRLYVFASHPDGSLVPIVDEPEPDAADRTTPAPRGGGRRQAVAASNPFLPVAVAVEAPEKIEPDPILGAEAEGLGLLAPRQARDVAPATPTVQPPTIAEDTVWLVGASGGVGVSTLARLAGGTVVDGGQHPPVSRAPVFVVATTHAAGLDAAAALARANARGDLGYDIRGLILVHDRPKLSRATVQLAKQVAGVYPRTMTVPFIAAWREPGTVEIPRNVRLQLVLAALAPKKRKKS